MSATAKVPDDFYSCGAEILGWYKSEDVHEFQGAVERAAAAARRARRMPVNSKATCVRTAISGPPLLAAQSDRQSIAFERPHHEQLSGAEEEAIAFAVDATIGGWEQAAASRLADALGEEIWTAFTHRWCPGNCQVLAEIARELWELKAKTHDTAGELADWLLGRFGRPTIEREVACALVKKIPWPTDAVLVEAARALRVIGVYICAQFGRDLSHCQCLKDLAHDLFNDLSDLFNDLSDDLALQELGNIVRTVESNVRPHLASAELEEIVRNVLADIRAQRGLSDV